MGGGYVDQGVVTYYSVINTKTVLQTKIPIPQSQSVHFGKIREDRCTKNAPEEPPPRRRCQNPRFGPRSWLLPDLFFSDSGTLEKNLEKNLEKTLEKNVEKKVLQMLWVVSPI